MHIKTKIPVFLFLGLGFLLLITVQHVFYYDNFFSNPQNSSQNETLLTIYTYESLLADPGYDIVEGFATYSGISIDQIELVKFGDANTIVSEVVLEKDEPVADVVIGLDNVLIHKAKEHSILEPYLSPTLENISTDLITNLDVEGYLLPYDYGIIAFYYKPSNLNLALADQMTQITLDEILALNLTSQLIVQNPTLSSPGLGFLLWTIAVHGDPKANIEGLLNGNWRDWWIAAKEDIRITQSWGDAWIEWADPNQNRPIMISYGSSPAYSAVLYNDTSEKAVVSYEMQQPNAWLQIEGIGLVKNAPHPNLAKNFIDWFLSTELQQEIPTNNWMYPANNQTEINPIFLANSINPENMTLLNDLISIEQLGTNLEMWQDDWEAIMVGNYDGATISGNIYGYFIWSSFGVISIIAFRYNQKKQRFLKD